MKIRVFTASLSKRTVQSKRNITTSFRDISNVERACVTESIRATSQKVNYAFITFCFPVNKSVYCSLAKSFADRVNNCLQLTEQHANNVKRFFIEHKFLSRDSPWGDS